jgi:hypothetical protein
VTWAVLALALRLGDERPLYVPADAAALVERVHAACEDCVLEGFAPCGDAGIGVGRRFFGHFFGGRPGVGYLVTHPIHRGGFERAVRRLGYEELVERYRRDFARTRLVAVRRPGYEARVAAAESVEVVIPRALHACAAGNEKPLCCCCAGCAGRECCEKALGSPGVSVRFRDPWRPSRTLDYTHVPLAGGRSMLYGRTPSGGRADVRFCLDGDGPGVLVIEGARR